MCSKNYLINCLKAITGALIAIPSICFGYYALFKLVTFLGN